MYYMMECLSPRGGDLARLTYKKDNPFRSWNSGARFQTPPPQPISVSIRPTAPGIMAELYDFPLSLMTDRLHQALLKAGVANLDIYRAEIQDPKTGQIHDNYVAFNIIGTIAAADLEKSRFNPQPPERMVSMDFQSVSIDEEATGGALMFRLAEAVNGIVVHEQVKKTVEDSGIDTLTFIPPEEWGG